MKSLQELLIPRKSIFDKSKRDTVLDLTDLMDKSKIEPKDFFAENFITDGMKALYEGVFKRFEGKSDDGVYRLKQTMGGGKTHNMIALGLLTMYPEYREKVMSDYYKTKFKDPVKVIAFSGYEAPGLGLWGYIAEKLGKKEVFKNYYEPLSAPGQTAWIELLKGEPVLILLDELAVYLDRVKFKQIGNSDLSVQTAHAITNLLAAIGKNELKNVCLIMSDLTANWQGGMEIIQNLLRDLESQTTRTVKDLAPVKPNSDEIYLILRKRLFENEASEQDIKLIASAYGEALKKAKLTGQTSESPEQFASNVLNSYPFHPGIKDLFARFKENTGFQQTRGMIRLMRTFLARMFDPKDGMANKRFLIHPYDFDLNDTDTLSDIQNVNRDLVNAIGHDIASQEKSVAERIDTKFGNQLVSETAKLILLSSLSNVSGGLKGLNETEIVRNIVRPDRVPDSLRNEAIIPLSTEAWYLHTDRDGNILFKDVKNVVAQLNSISAGYNPETVKKDLIKYLFDLFLPNRKDCYQQIYVLPSLDEIEISPDKVSLIIYTPHQSGGLSPDLQKFYDDQTFKNRLMFLSGDNKSLQTVNENAAQWKAINHIIEDLKAQRIATNSTEFIEAEKLRDNIQFNLRSSLQQTFVKLWYPHSTGLKSDNFSMQFTSNTYIGEDQVRTALKNSMKFREDVTSEDFRLQCEVKLFGGQKQMPWNEIRKNAAINIKWQWHKPDALEQLKDESIFKGLWREQGNWIEKGPFPPPSTEVRIQELTRNDETGEALLKITPVNGDAVHFEIGSDATTASSRVDDLKQFRTSELVVSFLCVDNSGKHESGKPFTWKNRITLRYRLFDQGNRKMMELKPAPNGKIRYSTDGSNPQAGALYDSPFVVPSGTRLILAVADMQGIESNTIRCEVSNEESVSKPVIDKVKPLRWKKIQKFSSSLESYEFFNLAKKYQAKISLASIALQGKNWWELSTDDGLVIDPEKIELAIAQLRETLHGEGQISTEVKSMHFPSGQLFEDYLNEVKTTINAYEIEQ